VISIGVPMVVSPPAWNSGIGLSCLTPGPVSRHSAAMLSVCQDSVLTVVIAPFGAPVVPEVCRMCVGRSMDRSVRGCAGAALAMAAS
jgi:hypothetical protein